MRITKLTLTGADDKTDIKEMIGISEKYPFVEWGILMARNFSEYTGRRFPSREWINELVLQNSKTPLNLSLHICGKIVEDIVEEGGKEFLKYYGKYLKTFQRLQINTHAEKFNLNFDAFKKFVKKVKNEYNTEIIIQFDGTINQNLLFQLEPGELSTLIDKSHGAGVVPDIWGKPIKGYSTGYAGGLGPDNLAEELEKIESYVCAGESWIDMETKVRSSTTEKGDYFDLDKCREVLEIVKKSKMVW